MAVDPVVNFGKVRVSTGYDASATSIALATGEGSKLPSTDGYNLVWWDSTGYPDPSDDPNVEIVRVTARTADALTVTRAQEGTSATTKNTSGRTYRMALAVTKKMIDDLNLEPKTTIIFGNVSSDTNTETLLKATPSVGTTETDISGGLSDDSWEAWVSGLNSGGSDRFIDYLIGGRQSTPTAVAQHTTFGSPASRTYTGTNQKLNLAMGAGTYHVFLHMVKHPNPTPP